MNSEIIKKYGHRVRIRVCGMHWNGNKLLLINHQLKLGKDFWAPVGGGIELGETAEQALVREFQEETTLQIRPGKFLFGCEFINPPLHAIELFFEVLEVKGTVSLGQDPESPRNQQILTNIRYMDFDELMAIKPDERHGILSLVKSAGELKNLSGFYRI